MVNPQVIELFIEQEREGTYFTVPFDMPDGVESLTLRYQYQRHSQDPMQIGYGTFTNQSEINVIDLGLIAPDGSQVGASGSDKREITITATTATPGYRPVDLIPGEWKILVGAYHVALAGVKVSYELKFTFKRLRLFKGDLHMHTLASDGVLTAAELGQRAVRHGLDFIAITDHNLPVSRDALPEIAGLTIIPGVEWTHYQGHANFLGIDRPFDGAFATNTVEETKTIFVKARKRGAFISINHPFEESCPFRFDLNDLPFDCLEIWNGPMRESNLKAVGLWHSLLVAGKQVPMCGGSDYHRDTPFLFLGGPTTCVYAMSAAPVDILMALRQGHSYVVFAPNGPELTFTAGEALPGDRVQWTEGMAVEISVSGLQSGDVLRVVTQSGDENLVQAPAVGNFSTSYPIAGPGFVRVEVLRAFLPGIPMLPALISNPIYFRE